MARRALVVGISKYPSPIETLEAATDEAGRWADVLRTTYAFTDVKLLLDEEATPTAVTDYLRNQLFAGVSSDDEIVFFYSGHGSRITLPGGTKSQETLFLYPEKMGEHLRKSALFTARDFSEILNESGVPDGARIDLILDTCHAAAFGPLPPGVKDLFVAVEDEDPEAHGAVERFAFVQAPFSGRVSRSRRVVERDQLCLIVAAAGERESATQIPLTPPRFVFSMLALEELKNQPRDSYRALIENIKQEALTYGQRPDLYGDLSREGFEFLSSKPSTASPVAPSISDASTPAWIARTLTIHIVGTGCFVSRAVAKNPFVRRLVLPYDNIGTGPLDTHIPFIEVRDDQILNSDKSFMTEPYPHKAYAKEFFDDHRHDHYLVNGTSPLDDYYYRRFVLSGHVITIPYVDTSGTFTVSDAFSNHVPSMTAVTPELFPYPRQEVFAETPQPGLISAFFDISYGTLDIGSLYGFKTRFARIKTGKPTVAYQTPKFVTLLLPLRLPNGVPLTIKVTKGSTTYEIALNETTDVITIGNEVEVDILGLESGDDVSYHFELYYNLSLQPPPDDRARPVKIAEPINSCTVTGWP